MTVLPVLTMPGGDITHPVPDLTGYITEGQIIFSGQLHLNGIYPPVDALSSLSRLMRRGGTGRTREDHLPLAAQLLAALAKARQLRELAELIGTEALTPTDRSYLFFQDGFIRELVDQRPDETRSLTETLTRGWQVVLRLARSELSMLPEDLLDRYGNATD